MSNIPPIPVFVEYYESMDLTSRPRFLLAPTGWRDVGDSPRRVSYCRIAFATGRTSSFVQNTSAMIRRDDRASESRVARKFFGVLNDTVLQTS